MPSLTRGIEGQTPMRLGVGAPREEVSRVGVDNLAMFGANCPRDGATDRWAASTEIRKAS